VWLWYVVVELCVGIITGNPGVFQGYPYPNPSIPVPVSRGTGLSVHGLRVFAYMTSVTVNK
jgi:hypothetical protein